MNWIKQHWIELTVFGAILGTLLACAAPDMTWMNTDSDGIHYTYAAKYLYPAHKTSAPLFLLLGHLFLKLPAGTEFWRISFMSVLASTASAVFIYLIIKEKLLAKYIKPEDILARDKKARMYGLIGALIFGGSALVIGQSTIVETYALVTMFGLGAYYFAEKEKWLPCTLMLGAGGAVHHLILIPILIILIFYKGFRKWKYIGIMASFLLFYLYVPITTALNNPPNMWGNTTLQTFWGDNSSTALMLIGGLSIWDLPKRILDTFGILGVSLGLALVPISWAIFHRRQEKSWYKKPLLWLFILPAIYYATDLAPQTYVYVMPAIGFGAIMAGIALSRMRFHWRWAVLGCAIGLLVFNANYFDLGRTLDPELSASKYYQQELDKVPNGGILLPQYDWEWAAIYSYNKENDRTIIPVCLGTLPSSQYQDGIKAQGVELRDYPKAPLGQRSALIASSVVEMNDNVWTTQMTNPRTYGTEVVPADSSHTVFRMPPGDVEPTWQWIPSNPYDIITGAIEVEEWIWIVFSNYSMLTFGMLGAIGGVPIWIGYMMFVKKKKWSLRKAKELS